MAHYFTFGSNHETASGFSLGNCFVKIDLDCEIAARNVMFKARGAKWAFSYPSAEAAGVDRFNLREVTIEQVTLPQEMK